MNNQRRLLAIIEAQKLLAAFVLVTNTKSYSGEQKAELNIAAGHMKHAIRKLQTVTGTKPATVLAPLHHERKTRL